MNKIIMAIWDNWKYEKRKKRFYAGVTGERNEIEKPIIKKMEIILR